jgi:hypothetical protein
MNIRKRMILKAVYICGLKNKNIRNWIWNNFDLFYGNWKE